LRILNLYELVGVSSRSAGAAESMVVVSTVTMSGKMCQPVLLLHGEVIVSPVPSKDTREEGALALTVNVLKEERISSIGGGSICSLGCNSQGRDILVNWCCIWHVGDWCSIWHVGDRCTIGVGAGNVVLRICLGLGISRPLDLDELVGVSSRSTSAAASMVVVSAVTMSGKMC
jgi:hypothetical protein